MIKIDLRCLLKTESSKRLDKKINEIPEDKRTISKVFKTIREWELKEIKGYRKAEYNSKSGKLYS